MILRSLIALCITSPSLAQFAMRPPVHCCTQPAAGPHELFHGVRADLQSKTVEFDATITPMLVKDERAPLFFLEVLACSPNTREHETFVVSTVKPSHIHAAMLAVGLSPGEPGKWALKDGKLISTPPSGDRVSVRFVYKDKDGRTIEADPLDWLVSARDKSNFAAAEQKLAKEHNTAAPGWVFAGSKFVKRKGPEGQEREVYDADGSGTIIGLTTFGSEVIAWSRVISPDSNVEEPEWIAEFAKTPPAETKVTVRIRKAQ
jgi:hypothetical protein